jgi:glutamate--cysteine ligase
LQKGEELVSLKNWSIEIYNEMKPFAQLLDSAQETQDHSQILEEFNAAILDSNKTLSGKLINELKATKKSFLKFNLDKAAQFRAGFLKNRLSAYQMENFERMAKESLETQKELEMSSGDFDIYLKKFLAT